MAPLGRSLSDPGRSRFYLAMITEFLVSCSSLYNELAILATLLFRRRKKLPDYQPPVSVLKPIRGRDAGFYEAIRSHAVQQYPEFELIFGAADPNDPALADIERLRGEFPEIPIRILSAQTDAPNGKVGALELMAAEARYETLLINDSDIVVAPDYFARVIALLGDERTGLVTCLYRARGGSIASRAEALSIATQFAPSVLVARLLWGGFALGSTMAFRASDLRAIGGFAAIREYLADDYQLGARISGLGKRVELSDSIVVTNLGAGSWQSVWKHQLRWARTVRLCQPGGYYGYLLSNSTLWCVIAATAGAWKLALGAFAIRLIAAGGALAILRDFSFLKLAAVPLVDLFGVAVWAGGIGGRQVEWRGFRFEVFSDGRMARMR